jgi:protein SCO1/2
VRKILPVLVFGLLLVAGWVGWRLSTPALAAGLPVNTRLGGELVLDGTQGRRFDLKDYRGKVVLLDFGYTFCPDICPTTLARLRQLLNSLGPQAAQVQVVFVSFDPERDTVDHLRQYLEFYDKRLLGATGSGSAIADATRRYGVVAIRQPMAGSYGFDHSDYIYLLDTQGRVRKLYDAQATTPDMQQDVQALLGENSLWRRIF